MDQAMSARAVDYQQTIKAQRAIEAFQAAAIELNVEFQRDGGALANAAERFEELEEQLHEVAELVIAASDMAMAREIEQIRLTARAAGVSEAEVNARVHAAMEEMSRRDEAHQARADAVAGRTAPLRVVEAG